MEKSFAIHRKARRLRSKGAIPAIALMAAAAPSLPALATDGPVTGRIAASTAAPAVTAPRLNFLVIVADDLGFSDLGAFGGEISTPNLDALARQGVRFTGFHTAPTCSPTRSALLSGTTHHRAGLGSMAEQLAPNQKGQPGYEGYLRRDIASLPERLRAGGYRTLFSGKWHLGLAPDQDPHARGFDSSFALLQGASNHFGQGISTDPTKGATFTRNGEPLSSLPAGFYSTDAFADSLIADLRASRQQGGDGKPFFAYLAFTAPHWPLQAPAEDIARYKGRYDKGFETLRQQRLARQVALGILDKGTVAHSPRLQSGGWDWLSAEQKQAASRDMEIYAAMVDRMDRAIGRVVEELRASGELDNTVIVFLADNGAEGIDIETTGAQLLKRYAGTVDNALASRGSAASYVTYGAGWAQAATAPSWSMKGYATEGGTRTVSFVFWKGAARAGSIGRAYLSVSDIAPTLLDLAGLPHTTDFAGRKVQPITGRSWLPWLTGKADAVYGPDDAIGEELFGSRSLRQGNWKITDIGDGVWRLFNLAIDPGETRDLARDEPQRLRALAARWEEYARQNGVILPSEATYRP